jgi:Xaa-Pro aminopeptidase
VASGPNAALPHAVPTDRPIQEGEPILIDMGARLGGYCSDMTRTIFLGEPRSSFKEVYAIVRKAQIAAQEALKAGLTGKQVDQVARDVIKDAGYGPRFVHSLGHGVGLAVHEAPTLSQQSRKMLRPGMVVTVEPGIYLPDQGGVRLENMALVEADGATILSKNDWFYEF